MADETCATCRFWALNGEKHYDVADEEVRFGHCRRYAPHGGEVRAHGWTKGEIDARFYAFTWPQTTSGDWCGEWETK